MIVLATTILKFLLVRMHIVVAQQISREYNSVNNSDRFVNTRDVEDGENVLVGVESLAC